MSSRNPMFWSAIVATLVVAVAALALARPGGAMSKRTAAAAAAADRPRISQRQYPKPAAEQLRRSLTPNQYEITQNAGTEPPFRNAFWDNHQDGLYVDVATGEPLFTSKDKFDSGTGWPSFWRPIEPGRVVERTDGTHGMSRVEVRSQGGGSHLGHVFDDGPDPTGLRYCINSASLRFIPVAQLDAAGYGDYRAAIFGGPAPAARGAAAAGAAATTAGAAPRETAILAGGCFWGMQDILRKIPGVVSTDVGYTGGASTATATYSDVHGGRTGHAESVRIVFDPTKLSYAELLEKWFFRMHDPTTQNRQGNDVGTQYRSAIFYTSPEQRRVAEEVKARVDHGGKWKRPVVTEIAAAGPFTRAEDEHQDYLQKNPGGYTCHYLR